MAACSDTLFLTLLRHTLKTCSCIVYVAISQYEAQVIEMIKQEPIRLSRVSKRDCHTDSITDMCLPCMTLSSQLVRDAVCDYIKLRG